MDVWNKARKWVRGVQGEGVAYGVNYHGLLTRAEEPRLPREPGRGLEATALLFKKFGELHAPRGVPRDELEKILEEGDAPEDVARFLHARHEAFEPVTHVFEEKSKGLEGVAGEVEKYRTCIFSFARGGPCFSIQTYKDPFSVLAKLLDQGAVQPARLIAHVWEKYGQDIEELD